MHAARMSWGWKPVIMAAGRTGASSATERRGLGGGETSNFSSITPAQGSGTQSLAGQELDRSTHRGSRSCYHISDIHHRVITSQRPLSLPNQLTPDGGRVFQSPRTVPGPEPAPFAPSPRPSAQLLSLFLCRRGFGHLNLLYTATRQ
jgi:hypothetical protein